MRNYYEVLGWAHGALAVEVPVPDPKVPDSKDIINKGNDAADWLSVRSGTFWSIIVILIVAALIASALKKAVVRGMLIGVILLGVALAIVNN